MPSPETCQRDPVRPRFVAALPARYTGVAMKPPNRNRFGSGPPRHPGGPPGRFAHSDTRADRPTRHGSQPNDQGQGQGGKRTDERMLRQDRTQSAPPRRDPRQPMPTDTVRPPSGATPRGTIWLYGIHAVAAALANPNRRLRRLILTQEAEAALAPRLRQPWPVPVERAERGRLDQLLGRDIVHQGAALLADPLAPPPLAPTLTRPGPLLVLDQVADPRNVGAILRSAAAFGAAAVVTQERNAPEETGALAKAACGALETVPLLRAVNIARTLVALKAAGCWIVGLDAAGPALSGPALAQRRVALVLGSEGEGLRRLTRDTCDEVAGLAMPEGYASQMQTLNVSVAAAIAMYELARRP
jgi:23S rRNA (guanosine2251-2'-O)-methyltransferase